MRFRVHFLDASGTIIQEMHAAAWNAAAAIALVKGMEWPVLSELGHLASRKETRRLSRNVVRFAAELRRLNDNSGMLFIAGGNSPRG